GLKNIDFFNFAHTLGNTTVYPFLILFVLLLPFFILAEKKAQDPVMNLSYFTNRSILTTLILSFVVGIVMMGMIFVPQFAENELKIASGSGGYFVIILGLFAGVGAPVSGKLIDKFGPKVILGLGFIISAIGAVFLIFITTLYPNLVTVITSLVLIGLGMGFTIGTPLNYMMLENTRKEESNSALATLSLVRSVGTAIAPAIMIGFLAHAGANIQTNVMQLLPKEVSVPPLPYAQELTEKLNMLKKDPRMKDKLGNVEMPDLSSMTKVNIDMGGKSGFKMPENLVELMKSSDVTTITKNSKILAEEMFALMTPELVTKIQDGVQKGIDGLNSGLADMQKSAADLEQGYKGISEGINGMQSALDSQKQALEGLESLMAAFTKMPQGMPQGAGMPSGNPMRSAAMSNGMPPSGQISTPKSIVDMIPAQIKKNIPDQVLEQLKTIKTPKDLQAKIDELKAAMTALEAKLDEATKNQADMEKALEGIRAAQTDMNDTLTKMVALRDAVPQAFVTAKNNYLQEIDRMKGQLEGEFQKTLNAGFKQVYLTVAIASFIALIILAFYKKREDSGEYDLSPKVSENLE
ncbi:MAG: MFS transporter, partial [Clostridia bacterium]|nr:MFS transporter [Clostridia bacterium]